MNRVKITFLVRVSVKGAQISYFQFSSLSKSTRKIWRCPLVTQVTWDVITAFAWAQCHYTIHRFHWSNDDQSEFCQIIWPNELYVTKATFSEETDYTVVSSDLLLVWKECLCLHMFLCPASDHSHVTSHFIFVDVSPTHKPFHSFCSPLLPSFLFQAKPKRIVKLQFILTIRQWQSLTLCIHWTSTSVTEN